MRHPLTYERYGTTAADRARRASPVRRELIGSLREDFDALAARIVAAAHASNIIVWVDDECRVYGTRPDALPQVPLHWIVGTYACGAPLGDIAADLAAERTERVRAWRLD
jgi:hypothetical protein